MKSVPLVTRGPVDDNNFTWVESQPRLYESKGEIGLRGLRHGSSPHRRGHSTGSIQSAYAMARSRDERGATVLPKIATGRSAHSAKKLWKDYETIKIRSVIQTELETPRMPPLYVPKNPKPLYKRPVDEMKHFDVLHLREFAERGEIEPQDLTDSREFYAQITFLRNAVRNTDGTTSYQNLCKRPRSWSEPSPTDNKPGLIKGNKLHWQSASSAMRHPRMLLPLTPGPSTEWYAWSVDRPSTKKRSEKKTKLKDSNEPTTGGFMESFTPRFAPHPTPATLKTNTNEGVFAKQHRSVILPEANGITGNTNNSATDQNKNDRTVEPNGITFITETKEENASEKDEKGQVEEVKQGDQCQEQDNGEHGRDIKRETNEESAEGLLNDQSEGQVEQGTKDGGVVQQDVTEGQNEVEQTDGKEGNEKEESDEKEDSGQTDSIVVDQKQGSEDQVDSSDANENKNDTEGTEAQEVRSDEKEALEPDSSDAQHTERANEEDDATASDENAGAANPTESANKESQGDEKSVQEEVANTTPFDDAITSGEPADIAKEPTPVSQDSAQDRDAETGEGTGEAEEVTNPKAQSYEEGHDDETRTNNMAEDGQNAEQRDDTVEGNENTGEST